MISAPAAIADFIAVSSHMFIFFIESNFGVKV